MTAGQTIDVDALRAPQNPPLIAGEMLAERYTVLRLLGHGAHGWVFRGEHAQLRYPVAIKVLAREASADETLRERFRREIILGAQLRSEHLARVIDSGETEGGLAFLVMEFVGGTTLAECLRNGPLGPDATVDLGMQLAEAVCALAAEGVVHRDIKPSNIVLRRAPSGRVIAKLVDLGISHVVMESDSAATDLSLTASNVVVGTPLYMAPEQLAGEELDARTDLYALSVVLFECLVGQPPYTGNTAGAVLARAVAAERTSLEPFAPSALAAIVERGLARDPAERWPSAEALIEALDEVALDLRRRGAAWSEVPLAAPVRIDDRDMHEKLRSGAVDPFTTRSRSNRMRLVTSVAFIAFLVVIAVTTVTSLFLGPGASPAAPDTDGASAAPR